MIHGDEFGLIVGDCLFRFEGKVAIINTFLAASHGKDKTEE